MLPLARYDWPHRRQPQFWPLRLNRSHPLAGGLVDIFVPGMPSTMYGDGYWSYPAYGWRGRITSGGIVLSVARSDALYGRGTVAMVGTTWPNGNAWEPRLMLHYDSGAPWPTGVERIGFLNYTTGSNRGFDFSRHDDSVTSISYTDGGEDEFLAFTWEFNAWPRESNWYTAGGSGAWNRQHAEWWTPGAQRYLFIGQGYTNIGAAVITYWNYRLSADQLAMWRRDPWALLI